jgi:TonB family protein
MQEYEGVDSGTLPDKTQPGGVKHNRGMDLETESLSYGGQPRRLEAREPAATMANDLLIQPDSESQASAAVLSGSTLDAGFGMQLDEKPIWVELYGSLRDLFFPPKLPPLQLTSTPIPVPDRMAVKRNPWAWGIATTINGAILALLLVIGVKTVMDKAKTNITVTPIDAVTEFVPPKAATEIHGGGGSPDKTEAIKGKIPPRATAPVVMPKVEQPPLPSIDVPKDVIIPDNPALTNFGMSHSQNVKLASGGNGSGMGMGSGSGSGYGPGSGGGIGGGAYQIGGEISEPRVIFEPEAEFSDEARRNKYQGVVLVTLIVDAQGNPQNVHVTRPLGEGLDEKAVEAVKKYRFKPALRGGKTPVPVIMSVEVNFQLF